MKKEKKWILIICAIVLCIFLLGFVGIKMFRNTSNDTLNNNPTEPKQDENLKYNTNEGVVQDKKVNDITFTNITCSFDGVYSLLEYTITNHSNQTVNLGEYEIIVKDKSGNVLANLAPTLDYELKPNESYDTGNAIDMDLSDAYSIELLIHEE